MIDFLDKLKTDVLWKVQMILNYLHDGSLHNLTSFSLALFVSNLTNLQAAAFQQWVVKKSQREWRKYRSCS